jgi:hypothetical protein
MVWLLTSTDGDVARQREEGRSSNGPYNKQQADLLGDKVEDTPALMLFRQNGCRVERLARSPFLVAGYCDTKVSRDVDLCNPWIVC